MYNELAYIPCTKNVDTPTLVHDYGHEIDIWIQWFGISQVCDLSGKQFLFPINVPRNTFGSDLSIFEIVMVGPLKNWPNKDALPGLIKQFKNEDTVVMYFLNLSVKKLCDGKWVPEGLVIPLNIKLADKEHGIIDIEPFLDEKVLARAIEKINRP